MSSLLPKDKIKYELNNVKFDFYSPEEIKRISMKQLTVTKVHNDLGTPNPGSFADPCMGVGAFDRNSTCEVCHQNNENCTGHFAHIELSIPVYNPFLLNQLLKLLNVKCFNCHKLKLSLKDTAYLYMKLFLIKFGLFNEAEEIRYLMYESFKEDTSYLNNKIIKFIKKNILLNQHYFDSLSLDLDNEDNEKDINSNSNSSNLINEDDKNDDVDEDKEKDKEKDNKKNKKKKKKENNQGITEEMIKKEILERKKNQIKELFDKIKQRHKEIIEKKPHFVYEPTLTSNTLIKDFEKEFWTMAKLNKCANCGAISAKFKKMNNLRFFRIMPSNKEKKKMAKIGIDVEKGALEHGANKREKDKLKSEKKKNKKEENDPINEFKDKKNKKNKNKKEEDDENMDIDEENENENNDNESDEEEEEIEEENEDNENYNIEEEKVQTGIEKEVNTKKQNFLLSMEVLSHIEKLFENDCGLVSLLFGNIIYNPTEKYQISIISSGINMFFIKELVVPPNRFRPENTSIGGDENYYHFQTNAYRKILSLDNDIKELSKKVNEGKDNILKEEDTTIDNNENSNKKKEKKNEKNNNNIQKKTYIEDLVSKCVQLQAAVNTLFDSSKGLSKKEQESKGIRQILEKKEGILRMKMMGKRVNHSGRTVISPDPLIDTGEIGIPLYIASKLFFPEKVTDYNLDYMKNIIKNGPFKFPGANQVISNDGRKISLMNPKIREKISDDLKVGQTVLRHMQNGDILLVNRQPTLHKPSIMAHRAKILPKEKTFRLHYSNCSSYNADFDGDEMNVHFLQDQISRGEGYNISNTSNQYIVPTDGKPIRGLLQDSIDSNVYLTKKDTFFTREEYYELLYCCMERQLNNHIIRKIVTVPPAIIKPKVLYTGKQLISSILLSLKTAEELYNKKMENLSLNYEHNTKIASSAWGKGHEKEGKVIVRNNELLTGVLDKNEIGNSDYGLFHSFYEIYGPNLTGELITIIGKLGVFFFQRFHAFTCSVSDILLDEQTNLRRRRDIENILMKGMTSLGKLLGFEDFNLKFDNYSKRCVINTHKEEEKKIIEEMKLTPEERKEIKNIVKLQDMKLDNTLFKHYSQKNLSKTEENDAYNNSYELIEQLRKKYESVILKESSLDINVDTVVKNTLNEETSNVPKNWLEKGLIYPFPNNRFAMMVKSGSKGSVVNHTLVTCMLGQQELEGRRAPRLPNGKTLPSFEAFDPNPRSSGYVTDRFSTGIRPQEFFFHAMAGREGLIDTAVKTSRSGYLQRCLIKHLEQLMVNYDYTVRDNDGNIVQFYYGEDSIDTINNRFLMNFKFIGDNFDSYMLKYKPERIEDKIDTKKVREAKLNKEIGMEETMLNKYEPWKYLGSVSEKVYEQLHDYIINDPDHKFKITEKFKNKSGEENDIENILNKKISRSKFKNIIFLKYLSSLIQPGESVGVLAAEAIGEPSTQMTLNTFHLAGHGGANVTLGIPRLREILMTSEKNIKTPVMTIPILSKNQEDAQKLARKFENYKLIDVLKEIKTKQGIVFNLPGKEKITNNEKYRNYEVKMIMEHHKNIEEYFELTKKDIIIILKEQFIPILAKQISRYMKIGMLKNEITAKKVTGNEDGIGGDESDEETNTAKYETGKKKGKEDEDDDEEENENEDKEEEDSEQEKTYDDVYQKTDDEEEKNNNDNESNEDEDKEEEEEDNNTNTEEITTTNDHTGSENDINDNNSVNNEDNKKNTKNKNKNFQKAILERKTYIYNNITIDNMKFSSSKEDNSSIFYFDLYIPYSQKNILLKNILNIVLKKINFKSVKHIKKCYLLDKENKKGQKEYSIQLEGFNFEEVSKYSDLVDINHISTNDIGGVLSIYGIEACRSAIVKEIVNVFDVYSIKVNKRHLGLIADYITFQGKYRSFSRVGISYCSSPLLKMTYETTLQFLTEACETKSIDKGNTPSSRIMLGRPPKCGTGAFDIFQK